MAASTAPKKKAMSQETVAKIKEKIAKLRSKRLRSGKAVAPTELTAVDSSVQVAGWSAWVSDGECGVSASITSAETVSQCTISAFNGSTTYAYEQDNPNSPPNTAYPIAAVGSQNLPQPSSNVASTVSGTTSAGSFSFTAQVYVYNLSSSS